LALIALLILFRLKGGSALEFNPKDNYGRKVFNFALAQVFLNRNAGNVTPTPVRVFFWRNGKIRLRLLSLTDWVNLEGLSSGRRKGVNIKFGVLRRRSKTWLRGAKAKFEVVLVVVWKADHTLVELVVFKVWTSH
jgi:hypothetical protein